MDTDCRHYVDKLLNWYLSLPDTPTCASRYDRQVAVQLYQRRIPLDLIKSVLLLVTARRNLRDPTLTPLPPVRSLCYFLPALQEILITPLPPGYLDYLRLKLRRHLSFDL